MKKTPVRTYTTALAAAAAAVALLVTGCSDDSSSGSSTPNSASDTKPAGGSSAASVDGKAIDAKFETNCAKQGDTLALALTDLSNATYGNLAVSATLNGDTVQAVGIAGDKGGSNGLPYAVGYGQGAPGGSAQLSKDDNTFTITGEGVGTPDLTNPTAVNTIKFDITFACSTIVG